MAEFFSNALSSFGETIPIMFWGMVSIFAVIIIIALLVIALNKAFR